MEIKYKLYPYPVLSSYSNDYGTGAFDVAIDIVRDGVTICVLISLPPSLAKAFRTVSNRVLQSLYITWSVRRLASVRLSKQTRSAKYTLC